METLDNRERPFETRKARQRWPPASLAATRFHAAEPVRAADSNTMLGCSGTAIRGWLATSRRAAAACTSACTVDPSVYGGRFFVVPQEIVLADIRNLIRAARSTRAPFGDPDFLNGPRHSLGIVRALHHEFPDLTFDFTAKVEHILKHAGLMPELAELGCVSRSRPSSRSAIPCSPTWKKGTPARTCSGRWRFSAQPASRCGRRWFRSRLGRRSTITSMCWTLWRQRGSSTRWTRCITRFACWSRRQRTAIAAGDPSRLDRTGPGHAHLSLDAS